MSVGLSAILMTVLAGMTSVASPCVFPLIPILVTGTAEDHRQRPLLIAIGLSISFILMGVVATLFGHLIAGRFLYIEKAIGAVIVLFGIFMFFDVNLFKKITVFNRFQNRSQGRWSGFLLGLSLGIIWIPCIGPILSGVLALVATQGELASGVFLLVVYSLGFSIPILIAGYSSQFFRQKIAFLFNHPFLVRVLSGILLIGFGLFVFTKGILSFSL